MELTQEAVVIGSQEQRPTRTRWWATIAAAGFAIALAVSVLVSVGGSADRPAPAAPATAEASEASTPQVPTLPQTADGSGPDGLLFEDTHSDVSTVDSCSSLSVVRRAC